MIKLLVGKKGTGKTKRLIDMLNDNVSKVNGNIVCIEKGMQATYHINSSIRIIDTDDYKIDSYEKFYGFFAGVLAGNYDIEQVYVDGLMRMGERDLYAMGELLAKMDSISQDKTVVVTVSASEDELTENVKIYL